MKWYRNLKIFTKLVSAFVLVALIAGVIGLIGIINIRSTNYQYADLYIEYGVSLGEVKQIALNNAYVRVNYRDIVLDKGKDRGKYIENIKNYDKKIDEGIVKFNKLLGSNESIQNQIEIINNGLVKFRASRERMIVLALADKEDEALLLMRSETTPAGTIVETAINDLTKIIEQQGKEQSDRLIGVTISTVTIMSIIIIGAIGIAILLGVFISKSISEPVKKMVEAADKLAAGDVNVNVQSTTKDELGILMQSFEKMVENIRGQAFAVEKISTGDLTVQIKVRSENDLMGIKLSELIENNNEILTNISAASDQVASGAKQVSESSQALSQGSTEQASSIEEVTSAIEQVASQTKQNALNASEASGLASSAKEKAVQGNEQMSEMLKAMTEINDSSNNISKIIKVIDEIAFQTNILALNAAVEAARAGQHGKGFAVVAEEVRNLAARSADAAKETTEMIEGAIRKVDTGTKIANNTAEALNQIVYSIAKAAELVGEIAVASNEQASGISQINLAITQVARVVETNSATAEESAAASEELSSQAIVLKEFVKRYKLKKNSGSKHNSTSLTPEMLRMLEEMVSKKQHPLNEEEVSEISSSKLKILLDDKDFGKYQ